MRQFKAIDLKFKKQLYEDKVDIDRLFSLFFFKEAWSKSFLGKY